MSRCWLVKLVGVGILGRENSVSQGTRHFPNREESSVAGG